MWLLSFPISPNDKFPWKLVWSSKVPSRVAFFSWTAVLGNILTTDNLWKRHFFILDWCCMCKIWGESMDHLLLHCPIAYELWTMAFVYLDSIGICRRKLLICLQLGKGLSASIKYSYLEACATLHYVVSLARTEFQKF